MRRLVGWGGRLPGPCRWRRRRGLVHPSEARPELARASADLPSLSGAAPLPLAPDSRGRWVGGRRREKSNHVYRQSTPVSRLLVFGFLAKGTCVPPTSVEGVLRARLLISGYRMACARGETWPDPTRRRGTARRPAHAVGSLACAPHRT
jgi:hypothetical protein